jgi:putative membrane protein
MARSLLTIGSLGALATFSVATAWPQTGPMPAPMHDWGWHGWWPLGGLIWLAFLGLVVVGLVTVVRWLFRENDPDRRSASSALAILEERYARGEINRGEYEQRRRDLIG